MWNDGDWTGWDWTAMTLMMVAFWSGLVALIVWIVRGSAARPNDPPRYDPSAEELLARRFARGEIDEDEYSRRRAMLREAIRMP